jgi:hypothetical protein
VDLARTEENLFEQGIRDLVISMMLVDYTTDHNHFLIWELFGQRLLDMFTLRPLLIYGCPYLCNIDFLDLFYSAFLFILIKIYINHTMHP